MDFRENMPARIWRAWPCISAKRSPDITFGPTNCIGPGSFECIAHPAVSNFLRYPGIVIVSDEHYYEARATTVKNLQRELPQLLQRIQRQPIAYWWLEQDEGALNKILSGITGYPVFVG